MGKTGGRPAPRVIGLTGNIACGKSTVARRLSELGVAVIDADQLSREVTAPGSKLLEELAREFGADVLDATGALNRQRLRELVFADEARRKKLESLQHPAIVALSRKRIDELAAAGHALVIYEATLLVETGRHRDFDGLLVVTCPPELQQSRFLARSPLVSAELAGQIIAAQLSQTEKTAQADWVLDNSGTEAELIAKVDAWHASIAVPGKKRR